MTPPFAALVDPIFHDVLKLLQKLEKREAVDLWRERATLRNMLERAETAASARDSAVRREDFELAKRGLVYWSDEVLTQATPNWIQMILEWEYYGTQDAGYLFYIDGERARAIHPDLSELWYLALALGFRGGIREAYENHLRRPLPGGSPDEDRGRQTLAKDLHRSIRLTPPPAPPSDPLSGDVRPLRGATMARGAWQLAALVAAVGLLLGGALLWRSVTATSDAAQDAAVELTAI